ncbi:MAG: 2-oxoglutarate dehydrogenase E1 component [Acidobacteria bacterium]|nr:2-oxoglutarate dehydrogenase E1 component [Acidobacteriota bacterium]
MPSDTSSKPTPESVALLASSEYAEQMYEQWRTDPSSLSDEWRLFFSGFDLAAKPTGAVASERAADQSKVVSLIFAYRNLGHLVADLDPLGDNLESHPLLELEHFGLDEENLDDIYHTGHLGGPQQATLREIIEVLRDTYCRTVGVEYLHIQDTPIRRWFQQEMEPIRNRPEISREKKHRILAQLIDAELFESFTHGRYQGQKRFSLEGAESLIPALHQFMETAAETGAVEVVMGMAHRGRLNVLANILQKPYAMIFNEFEDTIRPDPYGGDGDVKYHRGYSSDYTTADGQQIHISLTANPSHLEAVDPVVEGRTRAKQRRRNDTAERDKVLPILIHGDAAFAGQGLVAETFNLSQLKGYSTGGTVHIIVNNQIGFTTLPGEARSTRYPTDVAKMVEAPILHVNGDDPEAVVHAVDLALRFRQRFKRDVVIDMVCYRKHGHNEGDEPAFTQPLMYQKIQNRPSTRAIYQLQLEGSHDITLEESEALSNSLQEKLVEAFRSAKDESLINEDDASAFGGLWSDFDHEHCFDCTETGVIYEVLLEVAKALTTIPDGFDLNRKVARRLPAHMKTVEEKGSVDWALGELLAFGSLLADGTPVRLSGQDSIRGTFSQRHAAWFDSKSQEMYVPLNHVEEGQARFCVYNSMLSEAAVLGFDYGYSLVEPNMLVIWEAQFGDFANGAQVIIDQFIAAAFDKWHRVSGIVMLLPHGYEGQGPEHSNAYLERYLMACAEENMQVCNLTTPAQYFHSLRRQIKANFRRPLVIMSPKSLLRHKQAVSPLEDLIDGGFQEFLEDPLAPDNPRRLVFCSGKVYYDLAAGREERGIDDVAIIRVEQFYPFHTEHFERVVAPYRDAPEIVWAQEETRNRGGWTYMMPRLLELFPGRSLRYVGREPSASPATGSSSIHRQQQAELVRSALEIDAE